MALHPRNSVRLAAFDMDGTLLSGRLVFALAKGLGIEDRIKSIQEGDSQLPGHEKTRQIAALFAGIGKKDVESAVESIPLAKNCEQAIAALQAQGFKTGIISDSYTAAAGAVARRLDMDFVAANDLEFKDGIATGRVKMPMGWEKIGCKCHLSVCKRFHLEKYAAEFGVDIQDTVAVGDTRSDICMVRRAGTGIAFMPKDGDIARATQNVVRTPDMMQVVTCTLRRT